LPAAARGPLFGAAAIPLTGSLLRPERCRNGCVRSNL
jgi:hypothetical protein